MKQSVFKKTITAQGKYGKFWAEIIATMNFTSKTIHTNHPSTHDDIKRNIPLHKVEVKVNGSPWESTDEIEGEKELYNKSQYWIGEAEKHIRKLADTKPEIPFVDKMINLFEAPTSK